VPPRGQVQEVQSSAARYGDTVITDIQGELVKGILLSEMYSEMTARLVRYQRRDP
jgi:hypothetical protein